MTILGVQEEFL